jgi:hypothetical protein
MRQEHLETVTADKESYKDVEMPLGTHFVHDSSTKVSNLNSAAPALQQISWLDVTVYNVMCVQVVQPSHTVYELLLHIQQQLHEALSKGTSISTQALHKALD